MHLLSRSIAFPFLVVSLAGSLAGADQIRLMVSGSTGVAQIQSDLHNAHKSVDIMTYIWDPCSMISKMMVKEMSAKVAQKIPVRLVIDAYSHDENDRKNFTAYLQERGIQVRYFNIASEYNPTFDFRMHAKLMVIDGQKYYSGGRNISDDYFGMDTNNWIDRDVEVEGPSAAQAQKNFDRMWNSKLVSVSPAATGTAFAEFKKTCTQRNEQDEKLSDEMDLSGVVYLSSEPTYTCANVLAVADDPTFMVGNDLGQNPDALSNEAYIKKITTRTVVSLIKNAQKHVWIENYSYIPFGRLDQALREQRDKKNPIDVYTNDVMDTGEIDEISNHYQLRDNKGSEHIYDYSDQGSFNEQWAMTPRDDDRPKWSIHTKTLATADASGSPTDAFIGSFNFDPRSYNINLESGVVVRACPAFAKHVVESIERLQKIHDQDKTCTECHQSRPATSLTDKISAWLEAGFL